jgi:hypothetical protein
MESISDITAGTAALFILQEMIRRNASASDLKFFRLYFGRVQQFIFL